MGSYGSTFRTFRQNKGYTLKQVATGIVSVSFLSKFERGDSDISFSVMIELLDRMMVTYEEFYFLHQSGKSNAIEEFFNVAEEAYVHRDVTTIKQLKKQAFEQYQLTNHIPFHCNALLLEVYRSMIQLEHPDVQNEALQLLTDYLFDIEVWGYYELCLYNSTLFLLPSELVITFSTTVYEKSETMKKLPLLHKVLISILLNTVTYLTGGQHPHFAYEKESQTVLQMIEQSDIPEHDLHARLALNQAKGYFLIRLGKISEGTEKIEQTISSYKQLGAHNLAQTSAHYLKIILQKNDR